MKMTAAGKKGLMAAVVGLWMSLKHFINHSCARTKINRDGVCLWSKLCLSAESHPSAAASDPSRLVVQTTTFSKSSICPIYSGTNHVCVSTDWEKRWRTKTFSELIHIWNIDNLNHNYFSELNSLEILTWLLAPFLIPHQRASHVDQPFLFGGPVVDLTATVMVGEMRDCLAPLFWQCTAGGRSDEPEEPPWGAGTGPLPACLPADL